MSDVKWKFDPGCQCDYLVGLRGSLKEVPATISKRNARQSRMVLASVGFTLAYLALSEANHDQNVALVAHPHSSSLPFSRKSLFVTGYPAIKKS